MPEGIWSTECLLYVDTWRALALAAMAGFSGLGQKWPQFSAVPEIGRRWAVAGRLWWADVGHEFRCAAIVSSDYFFHDLRFRSD